MLHTRFFLTVIFVSVIYDSSARIAKLRSPSQSSPIQFSKDAEAANDFWPTQQQTVRFFESIDMEVVQTLNIKPGFARQEFIHRLVSKNFSMAALCELYAPASSELLRPLRIKARSQSW